MSLSPQKNSSLEVSDDAIARDLWFAPPIKNPGYAYVLYKGILRSKRLSDAHFQVLELYFLTEMNNFFCFSNLVACIIWFEYWFCTVT